MCVACAMLVAMSGCLVFCMSCIGVGPEGSFCRMMFEVHTNPMLDFREHFLYITKDVRNLLKPWLNAT